MCFKQIGFHAQTFVKFSRFNNQLIWGDVYDPLRREGIFHFDNEYDFHMSSKNQKENV
jgi:hypothetical protein